MASSSVMVTHAHPEGIAGAVAVAIATAKATACRSLPATQAADQIWDSVIKLTPGGSTARALNQARSFGTDRAPSEVAKAFGCGYDVSCQDTVPFAIWNGCRCLHDFREALVSTVEVGGDCDTNASIVCGIVASYGSGACIPEAWRTAREPLPSALEP
jgi:ADP-ribosylglycohydrolase